MRTEKLRTIIYALAPGILILAAWACSSTDESPTTTRRTTSGSGGTSGSTTGTSTSSTGDTTTGTTSGPTTTGSGGASTTAGSGGSTTSGTGGSTTGTGGSTTGTGGSTTGTGGSGTGSGMSCGQPTIPVANAVISNFDDAMQPLASKAVTPGGLWTKDTDGTGSISLNADDSGDAAQKKAAHFVGAGHTVWGADMTTTLSGAAMLSAVDASGYTGLSFKLKAAATNKATQIIVKFENDDGIPECMKGCSAAKMDCYAGYVMTYTVMPSTAWQTVTVPFANVAAAGWGFHLATKLDPSQIISIAIAVEANKDFDLMVDDVQFYK